jgi:hypothetical protein
MEMPQTNEFRMTAEKMGGLDWQEVTSSNVQALALHEGGLFIRFKSGPVYRYEVVDGERPPSEAQSTQELYEEMLEANSAPDGSVGKTFHKSVKGRAHEARVKIEE